MIDAESLADLPAQLLLVSFALLLLALAGCSSVPARTEPGFDSGATSPQPDTEFDIDGAPQQSGNGIGAGAVQHALDMVGAPYRYGGNTPDGFDCSGLVQYSYALAGMRLPRTVEELLAGTRPISRRGARPGDLLVFHLNGKPNSHVGLYIGNGSFVHAPSTGKFVSTESLTNPYWRRRLSGARRPHFD